MGDEIDVAKELHNHNNRTKGDEIELVITEVCVENWVLFMENEKLVSAIKSLGEKNVEFLYLYFVLRYTNIEIADYYKINSNAVAKWKRRVFDKIKIFFKNSHFLSVQCVTL